MIPFIDIYLGLFLSAFLSATLLPGASELLLISLADEQYDLFWLWFFATAGNTLGAVFNWGLGRYFLRFQHKKYFPFRLDKLQKAQQWFQRYGIWSMLFAWLPIVGDALTFIAGMMRLNFIWFLTLVAIGKGARYAILLGMLSWIF